MNVTGDVGSGQFREQRLGFGLLLVVALVQHFLQDFPRALDVAHFLICLGQGQYLVFAVEIAHKGEAHGSTGAATLVGALGKWLVSELQHRNPQDVIGMLTDLIVSVRAEFEEKKADVASAIEEARSFRPDPAQAFALGQDVIGRLAVEPLLDDLSDVTFGVILIFESPSGPSLLRAASLISDVIVHRAARLGGSAVAAARQVGNGLFLFFSAISSGTLMSLASLGQFLAALDKEVEKGICHFLHDSWNAAVQVGTLAFKITSTFVQADLEIIKKVLDLIVKLVADVGANILHDVQRLQDLFESFGNLERAIFQAPEFADIPAMAGKLHTAFTTGIGKALQAEAREQNVRLIDVLRSKISSNPVLTYLNNISAAMERIITMPSNVALAEGVHGVGGHAVLRTPNGTARREAGIGRPPIGSRATVLAELKKRSMQGRSRLVRPTADKSAMYEFSNSLNKGPVKGGALNATAGDGASSKEGVASDKKGTQKPEKHRHRAEGEVTVAPQDGKGEDQAGKRGAHRATNLELVDDAYKAAAEEVKSAPYQAPPAKPPANNVANAVFERWLALLEALKELDRDIWDLAFSGASNLDHPFTAEAKLHAVGADAVAAGGQSLGSDLFDISAWPQDAVNIIGGLITQWTHVSCSSSPSTSTGSACRVQPRPAAFRSGPQERPRRDT